MKLQENSLYTTPAERDALLKDKKAVMDALCFNLLGFLGCYRLGDTRGVLKTYNQTEGQLRLNAIGDKNHDVSLSVKLADDAHVIPTSAAQNVTKLLYMIKSRKIRGADLDDQKVRDLVKTLKISSNPPDSMINAIVVEFENGTLNLGQLAAKLYNLSKLPKFKTISSEFRALVSKGQFTELFAKTGTVSPAPVKITTSSPKTVAPAPVAPKQDLYSKMTPQERQVIYDKLIKDQHYPDYKQLPKAFEDAGVTMADIKVWFTGLASYICEQVFVEKKVDRFSPETCKYLYTVLTHYSRVIDAQTTSDLVRALLAATWLISDEEIEKGDLRHLTPILNMLQYSIREATPSRYQLPLFTQAEFKKFTTNRAFTNLYKFAENHDVFASYATLVVTLYLLNGGTIDGNPEVLAKGFEFDDTFAEWYIRFKGTYNSALMRVFGHIDPPGTVRLLNKVFDLKPPKIVTMNTDPRITARFVVPVSYDNIRDRDLAAIAKIASDVLFFYDADNWEADVKSRVSDLLSRSLQSIWKSISRVGYEALAMPKGYLKSEAFLTWFVNQLDGQKAADVFKNMPALPADESTIRLYLNAGVNFLDQKGVTPKIWMALYAFALTVGSQADTYLKDLEDLYTENYSILQNTLANAFAQDTRIVYSAGASLGAFMLRMHKENKFMPPRDMDFWERIAQFNAVDLGDWAVPDAMQEKIFGLTKDVDQRAIRTSLLQKYAHTREWYYGELLKKLKTEPNASAAVKLFLAEGWTDVLPEKEFPVDLITFVRDNISKLNAHETTFFSGENTVGQWAKDLVRDGVESSLFGKDQAGATLQSCMNALHLGLTTFNRLITELDLKQVISIEGSYATDSYVTLIKMWGQLENDAVELTPAVLQKLVVGLGMNMQNTPTPKSLEPCIDAICNMFNNLLANQRENEVDSLFDSMSYAVKMKVEIINWFSKAGVLSNALRAIKGDVITPLQEIDQTRLGQLMKYNNIKLPDDKTIDYKKPGFKLSDFLKTHGNWKLEPLAVTNDMDDTASLDRRTAEFDVFNKYRHGSIGVKFLRSFNVSIPMQIEATKRWDETHPSSMIMDPVFHGTGSIAASFILRYGFAVISAHDSSVVGRMLGDGVYFSNVLDKCGQYVSDGGYSRGIGNKGYVFQMRASLGQRGQDYQAGGGNLVSPEWCVFHPNSQLRIYKAHFVELVSKDVITNIKKKTMRMNENTAVRIYEMTDHLNEDIMSKGCISYTFIDGKIPISETEAIDFEHWDPTSVPSNVTMEYSGLGPVIYIQVDDPDVAEIYAVRYTSTFMNQGDDFAKYLQLVRGGATS